MKLTKFKGLKEITAILVVWAIVISSMMITTYGYVSNPIRVDFGSTDVWGLEEVDVTVTFRDTAIRQIPFEIVVTNGAEIMVEDISDVWFYVNGQRVDIDYVDVSPDKSTMTLSTSNNVAMKDSYMTFPVKAPLVYSKFTVYARNSDTTNPNFINGEGTTAVRSGLTIEAPDFVDDVGTFTIHGEAMWNRELAPDGAYVFLEVVDPNNHAIGFNESQSVAFVNNSTYTTGNTVHLYSDLPDGDYLIRAFLVDVNTWDYIGYAERPIHYTQRPDVLRVSLERPGSPQVFKVDPLPGTGVRLTGVTVNSSRYVLASHTVTARTTIKSEAEAAAASNAKFVAYTAYGEQTFTANKMGTTFYAQLSNLRTGTSVTVNGVTKEPYIVLRYTYQGEIKEIYIGSLQVIIDPGGYVLDAETGLPVEGAEVTLYRRDDDDPNNWFLWEAHDGQTNPQITDAEGAFLWDVEEGIYKIMVYHPDYNTMDSQYSTLFDDEIGLIVIPPERYDIVINLPVQI